MLDFSRFSVVTFDCYGTLIDWETGILGALRPILAAHNAQLSDPEILRLYGELEAEAEAGVYRPYRDVLREVVRRLGDRLGFQPTAAEQNSLPQSIRQWEPFPDTVASLARLKSRVGIISNIDEDLFADTAPKLQTDFDFVVTGEQARAYKPSLAVFRQAEERLGLKRSEWLHAGQSIYHDVVPAKSLGIATVWVNRPSVRPNVGAVRQASARPDFEVHNLAQLANAF